jgi:riboflavin biosynthesis pyrimidine reductase
MGKVTTGGTMSLDGYIAGPEESGFDLLFQWYGNGGQMARQCLEAGLLDEVGVELVPVVLGGGTPLFAELSVTPVQFEGPVAVVEGTGVTHLRYRVKK